MCPADEVRACTTSPSIHRSLNSSPDWMCSASRIASWPTRRMSLGALEILTRPRIDLDLVAGVHEERHVHPQPRLERCRLRRAGGRVALEPEVGRGDGH